MPPRGFRPWPPQAEARPSRIRPSSSKASTCSCRGSLEFLSYPADASGHLTRSSALGRRVRRSRIPTLGQKAPLGCGVRVGASLKWTVYR